MQRNEDTKMREKYKALFDTLLGEDVLADLRKQFYEGELVNTDPHRTVVAAAQHDVVDYIIDMASGESQ